MRIYPREISTNTNKVIYLIVVEVSDTIQALDTIQFVLSNKIMYLIVIEVSDTIPLEGGVEFWMTIKQWK